jgi:hypothetical protein
MNEKRIRSSNERPTGMSRRRFLRLAAATGLLAGCVPSPEPTATPTVPPTATHPPEPTSTPTRAPTATPTVVPTPTPSVAIRRPEVIQAYPDVLSKVVRTHHAGVWDGDSLVPGALRQMLDASITGLTGLNDAREAWAALFSPDERIAIKVNTFRNSLIWTHTPLVMAVTDSLQEAGVPPEQIVIFDFYTNELEEGGYTINRNGPGVRCYGSDGSYTSGWKAQRVGVQLSDILLSCHALINVPVLKSHMISGISFALKNHYGTVSSPGSLHTPIGPLMAELNALGPIRDRTRLIIGDMLTACLRYRGAWPYWESDWTGDSILMSFDPVAHDTIGLQILSQALEDEGGNPAPLLHMAESCLEGGVECKLGTNDPAHIDLREMSLA